MLTKPDFNPKERLGKGPKKSAKSVVFDQTGGGGQPKPNPYCIVIVDSQSVVETTTKFTIKNQTWGGG